MLESYKLFWENYANFRGRTPRRGYWWVQLWNFIIYAVLGTILYAVIMNTIKSAMGSAFDIFSGYLSYNNLSGLEDVWNNIFSGSIVIILLFIAIIAYFVASIVPMLSLGVRRLHDTGRRWYWLLILLVPRAIGILCGIIVLMVALLDESSAPSYGSLLVWSILLGIVRFMGWVFWIILMCQPTSRNAMGVSTHEPPPISEPLQGGIVGVLGMYANFNFSFENDEEIVIGRDATCSQIVINQGAEKVSRMHVSISYDPKEDVYVVTDLSSNGTYLNNGVRLRQNVATKLLPGSVIYLAKQENSFRLA